MADDESGTRIVVSSHTELEAGPPEPGEPSPLVHGTVLGGRFVVERVLGRGGMGLVVRAYDRVLGVVVAVKILRPELRAERRWADRLAREVKLARQIRHLNVCRVFDFQEADGHAFLVMELAPGGSLRAELDAGAWQARPLADRLADARAITAGLAAIHDAGIVHRDITPQNVLRMGDGRLVVSDFGLATDASASTTSVHGGTVAYMAPEVVRGDHATFASDVWALGMLIHEVVFGARPRWRDHLGGSMLAPVEERKLSSDERRALDLCRQCTVARADARPTSASAVLSRWDGRSSNPVRPQHLRPAIAALCFATILVASLLGIRARRRQRVAPTAPATDRFALVGEPEDWTERAKPLATVQGRIHCLVVLPGDRSARFVWGAPSRAEDLDLATGIRRPSPLVPAAYENGCPDLSSDGKRLLYQGHDRNGRSVILLSNNPDGSDAVPVVGSAEPSVSSEPKWLPDGRTFVFDADPQHVGVFVTSTNRTTILPDVSADPVMTVFRFVVSDHIVVAHVAPSGSSSGLSSTLEEFEWPSVRRTMHIDVPWMVSSLYSSDRRHYYSSDTLGMLEPVVLVDVSNHSARRIGLIRDQFVRRLSGAPGRLIFVSARVEADAWVRDSAGALVPLTTNGRTWSVAHCGPDEFIASTESNGGARKIVRLSRDGQEVSRLTEGPGDNSAACLNGGNEWIYESRTPPAGLYRCRAGECARLVQENVFPGIAVSPDETRIAYVTTTNRGPHVRWISSHGGQPHEVADTETICAPGWSSNRHLWISRRVRGRLLWSEIDADTGAETGRSVDGAKDCTEGGPDPMSPVDPDLRIVDHWTSQVRFLPTTSLSFESK